ncbi:MAG: topoisomerase-4 subunit A, partial [Colwellia sp.]
PEGTAITLYAGKRKLTLKSADIEHYKGERGRRGNKLPRGLQRVSKIEVESGQNNSDSTNETDAESS